MRMIRNDLGWLGIVWGMYGECVGNVWGCYGGSHGILLDGYDWKEGS